MDKCLTKFADNSQKEKKINKKQTNKILQIIRRKLNSLASQKPSKSKKKKIYESIRDRE